ncbi:MAG: protein kinase, partial [Anaerolineae bacterium]|nr:protein kinase [Anaerolineae bacterium]
MSDLVGKTIGQYQIISEIGIGGMATVYKARQASVNRFVAIKVLPTQFARDPNFVKRFRHEAQAIAALEHVHILPLHDFGTEDGYTYMVMRYITGGTLADYMGRPMNYERVVKVIGDIARALDYAHQRGVIHRDVKPSNILIDEQGEPLLTDFGIAKVAKGSNATRITGTGLVLGTPEYIAPEQAENEEIDGRSDIYSLGVVMYELLTGRPPYQAHTPLAVVMMHVKDTLPPSPRSINPDIPEALESVVMKAMAKDPKERFQTAGEMADTLKQALRVIENPSTKTSIPGANLVTKKQMEADPSKSPSKAKVSADQLSEAATPKRRFGFVWLMLIFIIIGGLAFAFLGRGGQFGLSGQPAAIAGEQPTTTPTHTVEPTTTPAVTKTPTPIATTPPSNTPTPSPEPTTVVITPTTSATVAQDIPQSSLVGTIAYPVFNGTDYDIFYGRPDGSGTRFFKAQASQPAFSPDGSRIAFHSWQLDPRGIITMDVFGTESGTFVSNFREDQLPTWTADGREIILLSRRSGERKSQLIRVSSSQQLGESMVVGEGEYPSVGPTGQLVFKGWGNTGTGIQLSTPTLSSIQSVTGSADDTAPALSPDGQKIVF